MAAEGKATRAKAAAARSVVYSINPRLTRFRNAAYAAIIILLLNLVIVGGLFGYYYYSCVGPVRRTMRVRREVRHESGGKDDVVEGKGHSLVQTAASTYDLPPLSTVVLKSRTPAGEWEAYGQTMNVELLTVNVTYSLFVAPSPEKDKPPTPYL